jgi:hypothetical protein
MDGNGTGIGPDQPDLVAEFTQRLGQGLAVLATLGEAAARLAAEEARRKERRDEQQDKAREIAEKRVRVDELARHAAARREAKRDRDLIGQALDDDWLGNADLLDLATVWRAGRARESQPGFPGAMAAAQFVEDRLRDMYPRPMDRYDQAVAAGASRAAAMREAAEEMAKTRPSRPQGGRTSPALHAPDRMPADGFAAAVEAERDRIRVDAPDNYPEELRRLGAGGQAADRALREMLASRDQRGHRPDPASVAAPDGPASARSAAALAATWYPDGLSNAGVLPAHTAGKRPARSHPARRHTTPRTTGRGR